MPLSTDELVRRYNLIRKEIREKAPEQWEITVQLCQQLPTHINHDIVWKYGRDKPCWAYIRIDIGERIARDIINSQHFDSYKTIAGNDWEIRMFERGSKWKANNNFELVGKTVRAYVANLPPKGISSYRWRLYASRSLAVAIKRNAKIREMLQSLEDNPKISPDEFRSWTKRFSSEVGTGWGAITVCHMLADLGLAPKPDRHVVASAVRMGLMESVSTDATDKTISRLDPITVVAPVIKLSEAVRPTANPQDPRSVLREVDKVLMEWNRQKLSRPL